MEIEAEEEHNRNTNNEQIQQQQLQHLQQQQQQQQGTSKDDDNNKDDNIKDNKQQLLEDNERALLAGFSRITTRDRDEVIQTMCQVVGDRCTPTIASFFLDMNDWNLQEAVCSYLELNNESDPPEFRTPNSTNSAQVSQNVELPLTLPFYSMKVLSFNEVQSYLPGADVNWYWVIVNNGETVWPEGCVICPEISIAGNLHVSFEETPPPYSIKVDNLSPGSTSCITLKFKAPLVPGTHTQPYRLYLPNGWSFGETLYTHLEVVISQENTEQANAGQQNMEE